MSEKNSKTKKRAGKGGNKYTSIKITIQHNPLEQGFLFSPRVF